MSCFTLLGATTASISTHLTYFLFLPDSLHLLFSEPLGMTSIQLLSSVTLTLNPSAQLNVQSTPNTLKGEKKKNPTLEQEVGLDIKRS